MCEQVANGDRQIMIWVHQSRGRRDDSVPVGIRVVGEGHAKFIFESDESGHRVRAGTIHSDFSVVIH
jgi:hypothetical protein